MPRIRTIKPEFWRSPDVTAASPVARLLFIAMWNWADDAGRGEADLKALEGFAFPNDDVRELSGGTSDDFRSVVAEVVECFGVTLYMVDGRPYYEIPSWKKHQRNERTAQGKYPTPKDGVTCTVAELGGKRRNFRHTPSEPPQTSGPGTGEQGNRGTGEQVTLVHPDEDRDDRFDEFWAAYPRREAKQAARKAWAKATKRTDPDVILAGVHRYASAGREKRYTAMPASWLNDERWTDEVVPNRPEPGRGSGTNVLDWTVPANSPPDYLDAEVVQLREIGR